MIVIITLGTMIVFNRYSGIITLVYHYELITHLDRQVLIEHLCKSYAAILPIENTLNTYIYFLFYNCTIINLASMIALQTININTIPTILKIRKTLNLCFDSTRCDEDNRLEKVPQHGREINYL